MNHKLLGGLTATLLIATLGVPLPDSLAKAAEQQSEATQETQSPATPVATSNQTSNDAEADDLTGDALSKRMTPTPVKPIAKVHSHEQAGRQAATLYVRNIPILTFLGSSQVENKNVTLGYQLAQPSSEQPASEEKTKLNSESSPDTSAKVLKAAQNSDSKSAVLDPVGRANQLAEALNELNHQGMNAKAITVSWDKDAKAGNRYLIKAGDVELATIDAQTLLPDSTRSLEQDALQAANRLRRILGDAAPIREVTGKPRWQHENISVDPGQYTATGMASWYGPGFDGNMSASGEVFNQYAMTAAHPRLPFGTRLLVTNLDNGQSVVVRVNDRGPYAHGRIIDLSKGAADKLGLTSSGVAPVRIQVVTDTIAGN